MSEEDEMTETTSERIARETGIDQEVLTSSPA